MGKSGYLDWAYLVVAISITIIIFGVITTNIQEKHILEEIIEHDKEVDLIHDRIEIYKDILIGTSGLFAASEKVTMYELDAYMESQKINERVPGIQGLGYVEYVQGQEKYDELVLEMKEYGFDDYKIKPEGIREEYFPVKYLHPNDFRNQRAMGYDVFSEENRASAVQNAIKTRDISVTKKIILVQETETDIQNGFLMLMPVFSKEDNSKIMGLVYGVFRINDLMEGTLSDRILDKSHVVLYDNGRDEVFYDSRDDHKITYLENSKYEKSINVGGQTWTFMIYDDGIPYNNDEVILSIFIIVLGAALSVTVFFVIRMIGKNTIEMEINSQKIKFDAMISHELKTPLVPIKGYVEMLTEPNLVGQINEKQKTILDKILKNINHLETLLEKILKVQRHEMGRHSWKMSSVMLSELMKDVMESNSSMMKEKNILFENTIPTDTKITTSVNDMKEVFTNIIQNAVDFVPNKRGKIKINSTVRNRDILFSISNNGPEIPKEKIERLFAKYYQVDTTVTRKHGGTGLGLVICRDIVEGLGGKIGVESEIGKDVVFYFSVPKDSTKYTSQEKIKKMQY